MATTRDPATHLRHAFVRDGRLTSLPTRAAMLDAACAFLVERFEPDRLYDEREVNAILADDAPDVATLRRMLVDRGYLGRRKGAYWRERPTPSPTPSPSRSPLPVPLPTADA